MPKIDHDTRQKILAAAEQVFHGNGFKGARTSQIAEVAGISRTMLHYYFSTKEALFQAVLEDSLGTVVSHLKKLIDQGESLEKVIENLVNVLCDLFDEKPGLPTFIINILNETPQLILFLPAAGQDNLPHLIDDLVEKARQEGSVNARLSGEDLILNIYGICAMPYLGAPYIAAKEDRSPEAMQLFFKNRRRKNLDFILHGIQKQ
jgi:TetR/AcrR family transcriptional regulator